MGTTTTHYGFYKIDSTVDLVDVVTDFNNNWDSIDSKLFAASIGWFNVLAYGADPTGVADSTTDINAAITAAHAAGGGVVYFPAGTYKIIPTGSPAYGLNLSGMKGIRLVGVSATASVIKKAGNGVLVNLSGTATGANNHLSFCSVENLGFDGGTTFTGQIFQCYYCDDVTFRDVNINNNPDVILGTAEMWDSRFYNVVFGGSGSTTANASTPNILLQNSAASSGFGLSTDSSNQIYFHGCRWEAFHTGAIWIQEGPGNVGGPNDIFLTDCKMETSVVNGGPHILVDSHTRAVHIKHLYAYSGGFSSGYSTAQDVITYSAQMGSLEDILISDGSSATIANGVTVSAPSAGQTVALKNIWSTYTTAPTGAHIGFGTITGRIDLENCPTNTGTQFGGTVPTWYGRVKTYDQSSTSTLVNFGGTLTDVPGATISVVVDNSNSTVVIDGTFDFFCGTSTCTFTGHLNWNGADQTRQAVLIAPTVGIRGSVGQTWRITGVAAGTYTAKLQATCTASAAQNAVESPHSSISVQVIS